MATATSTTIKPLEDRILVRPEEAQETTVSGIVIPDTAKEKPQEGTVLAVGPGKRSDTTGELIQVDVKEGDRVMYSKYGGTEIKVDGEELLVLRESDVLANAADYQYLGNPIESATTAPRPTATSRKPKARARKIFRISSS